MGSEPMDETDRETGSGFSPFRGIRNITRDLRQYVEKRTELMVLTVTESVTHVIAGSIQRVAGLMLLYTGFLFAWAALGFWLGELTGSTALGFLLSSLPLLLGGILFVKLKPDFLKRKIQTGMMQDMLESLDMAVVREETEASERDGKRDSRPGKPGGVKPKAAATAKNVEEKSSGNQA